jgi:hypothetical protein
MVPSMTNEEVRAALQAPSLDRIKEMVLSGTFNELPRDRRVLVVKEIMANRPGTASIEIMHACNRKWKNDGRVTSTTVTTPAHVVQHLVAVKIVELILSEGPEIYTKSRWMTATAAERPVAAQLLGQIWAKVLAKEGSAGTNEQAEEEADKATSSSEGPPGLVSDSEPESVSGQPWKASSSSKPDGIDFYSSDSGSEVD